ncbi:MAG: ABC transporter permease [Pseudomonadota bacterium]
MRLALYLLPRIGTALLTLFGVAVLVFLSLRLIPGGYADIMLGPFATEQSRAAVAARYGLDQPAAVQFGRWLWAMLGGDFGVSMVTQKPVIAEFLRRAPVTLELALMALAVAVLVGAPLGVASGVRAAGRGGAGRLIGALGASVPDFVLGSVLIFVFSVNQLWFRVGGFVPFAEDPVGNLRAMTLPVLTLSVFGMALILRTTREAVLRVMTEGHITAAVARGDAPRDIVRTHVLRNAAIPVVTVAATYFGFLMGGAVVVEVLYSIPGVGLYIFNGLMNRDYAIVQTGVLLAAAVFIGVNMLADALYAVIDPRVGAAR